MTFEELGIDSNILKAINELGYETPMPIQEKVIPVLLQSEHDVIGLAQTGTGKTAAFGIPIIQKTDLSFRHPQSLILCPTRELCLQIADDLIDYSKYQEGLKVLPVYGGSSIESQIRSLKKGVHIIVATPGRLIDLMKRGTVKLDAVRNVVMDEADEMLNMGFTESINAILAAVPQERTTLLFSATMPNEIARIAKTYMHNPQEIVVGNRNESTNNVKHRAYVVHAKDKYLALKRIADYYPNFYGIVFCRTRKETQEVADALIRDGYNADSLHGDLSQQQRDYVMQKFRIRNLQILVATDVAARGLDVDDLSHVVNYGLPDDIETYTHRSGRTGRAGKTGISIAIIHSKERHKLHDIERKINKKFEPGVIPTGKAICEKQLINLIDKIEKVEVNEAEIADLLPVAYRKLDWLSKEDVIKRLISMEFNRMFEYYRDADELDVPIETSERQGKVRGEKGFARLFVNYGKMDGMMPPHFIEIINQYVPKRIDIGRIDILPKISFIEVRESDADLVIRSLNKIKGLERKLVVDRAQPENTHGDNKSRSGQKFASQDRKPRRR
ncbi:DEAD/DEAH box helicase [Microbacter margulisiae]|uniref:DEAD-box ATP-dependent RNA helicase RhpA n=1 Tax=Microbacter margulisiae TaxID=1350067 RepID=A0A7W5DSU6_9PORP|nr:DEAD/DEAH box helicase [Microbacter margulisiae]MBB3188442.1 ATP-dependent RNA helicase DeaD [Microbacter margulisiae]